MADFYFILLLLQIEFVGRSDGCVCQPYVYLSSVDLVGVVVLDRLLTC